MRTPDLVVISDLHLGHPCCRATELLKYFETCRPLRLILAGDIMDLCDGRPWFWSRDQQRVLERIFRLAQTGVQVDYITGNHDRALARLRSLALGGINIQDKTDVTIGGRKYLVTHGDRFDKNRKFFSTLVRHGGGYIYDVGMAISQRIDRIRSWMGLSRLNLATRIKHIAPGVNTWLDTFINRAAQRTAAIGYDGLICGHLHVPDERWIETAQGSFHYLNSGDWVEHASALEFIDGSWTIHVPHHHKQSSAASNLNLGDELPLAA